METYKKPVICTGANDNSILLAVVVSVVVELVVENLMDSDDFSSNFKRRALTTAKKSVE